MKKIAYKKIMEYLKSFRWFYLLPLLAALPACHPSGALRVYDLRCEHIKEPLGVDNPYRRDEPVDFKGFSPRVSWKVAAQNGQVRQAAYRVIVSNTPEGVRQRKKAAWDSGVVEDSRQRCFVPDSIMQSSRSYYWTVGVYGEDLRSCTWSAPAKFSTGLLKKDWQGEWIGHPAAPREHHLWFRKNFVLRQNEEMPGSVFAYVASAGYHELHVNGVKVDDRVLAPAASRIDKRVLYVTYDIGALLKSGQNVMAVSYGPGWSMNSYFASGAAQAIRVQVYGEGSGFSIFSDSTWKCSEGYSKNIGRFDFMDMGGELVDGRSYTEQWMKLDFDDSKWRNAAVSKADYSPILSSQMTDPSRIIETIPAKAISEITDSTKLGVPLEKIYRVDMGKEFTGFLEARFEGLSDGDTVEVMVSMRDANPEFVQATYGVASKVVEEQRQKQIYIARGEDGEVFRNRFNFFAGRYIHFKGLKKAPKLQSVKGLAISSAAESSAAFSCSDSLYGKIFDLDRYTYQMCHTEGVTVDCPNRERLGYGPEGAYQTLWGMGLPCFSSAAHYVKNVRDWADVQLENGFINNVAPQVSDMYGCVLNGTAILNIAWEHYRFYGDRRVLEMAYPVGRKWVEFLSGYVKGNMLTRYAGHGYFLGEWVSPGPVFEYAETDEALFFNNCAYAMTLDFMVKIGKALGSNQDAAEMGGKLAALREALHRKYYKPEAGSYLNGDQVRTSFALFAGIVPDALAETAEKRLKEKLEAQGFLDVGSFGRYPFHKTVIERRGYLDMMGRLLRKTAYPSYGYFVAKGCTTLPEMWEIDQPNSTLIHTSYTGVSALFIKGFAGIREETCGYDTILMAPEPIAGLSWCSAKVDTPYGLAESAWKRGEDGGVSYHFTVPFGAAARLRLSGKADTLVLAGSHSFYRHLSCRPQALQK